MAASPPNALPWATGATPSTRGAPPQRLRVPAGRELRGDEEGHRSTGSGELERALHERDREVGEMRKSGHVRRPPRGVAGCQRLPHLGGHPLAADPGWVPGNEVEPAARQDVGEVRLEREERGTALAGETARGHPELAATRAHPPEQRALVRPKPPPPSEQIAILARGDQLGGAPLERRDGCREQAPCERPLGTGELTQRLLLGRSGEAEERAPGTREPLDLPRRSGGCRGTAERAGQGGRVDQGISLSHVAVPIRPPSEPGKG